MDLNSLKRTDLVLMCNQLGIGLGEIVRKPHIVAAILALNADDNELIDCWEKVKENKRAAEEEIAAEKKRRSEEIAEQKRRKEAEIAEQKRRKEAEIAEQKRRKEAEIAEQKRREEIEQTRRDFELNEMRLKLEQLRLEISRESSQSPSAGDRDDFKQSDQLQPVNEREVGLFSVNLERTCETTTRAAQERVNESPGSLHDREEVLNLARSNDRQELTGVDKAKCVAGPRANLTPDPPRECVDGEKAEGNIPFHEEPNLTDQECTDTTGLILVSMSSSPTELSIVEDATNGSKQGAYSTLSCLQTSVEGAADGDRGEPQAKANEAGELVALDSAETRDESGRQAPFSKGTLHSAEECGADADPHGPQGNASPVQEAEQHKPLSGASFEAVVNPGSQRNDASCRSQLLDSQSPGIGASPLECAVKPKRKRRKRSSQGEKPHKEPRQSRLVVVKAKPKLAKRGKVKERRRRVRGTNKSIPDNARGREKWSVHQRAPTEGGGFHRNFRGANIRRRRIRHGQMPFSPRPMHLRALGERHAYLSRGNDDLRHPPGTVLCKGLVRPPDWGRIAPTAFSFECG